jgi:hypothetical protein
MTERDLGNSISWWIGEVVNVYDPWESGRVQVRVYGRHDDTTNIPNEDLPWAVPMQNVTSAGFGRMGTAPVGLVKGSRVIGLWMDNDHLYPIIMGSVAKAGDYKTDTTEAGSASLDIDTSALPPASQASLPYDVNIRAALATDGQAPPIKTIDNAEHPDEYNSISKKYAVANAQAIPKQVQDKVLNSTSTTPTTASSKKPTLKQPQSDVQDVIMDVDPHAKSASLSCHNRRPSLLPQYLD